MGVPFKTGRCLEALGVVFFFYINSNLIVDETNYTSSVCFADSFSSRRRWRTAAGAKRNPHLLLVGAR